MTRIITLAVAISALLEVIGASVTAAEPPPNFDPPRKYYLALGDSLAFGFQWRVFNEHYPSVSPELFAHGYVDRFGLMLAQVKPGIQTRNFGCVGETTDTFIQGGCLYTSQGFDLHEEYSGSQLDAALAFLRANPGKVSPVTLNLGTNDLNALVDVCGSDFACYQQQGPTVLSTIEANLDLILGAIRAAAPYTEIITFTSYTVAFLSDPRFLELTKALNAAIERTGARHRARVADVFAAFNDGPQPAAICELTLICSEQDSHPSDVGYQAIAAQLWDASGYVAK